jgi:hypothetical protein
MKKLLAIAALLVVGHSVMAQEKAEDKNKPDFKFVKETHDFGNIKEGELATYEFVFTNVGKEPLIITNVAASCGCTTPTWTREPIKPGEQGKIKAVYNSANRPGPFTKSITISSNAKTPTKVVNIKGVVDRVQSGIPENKPATSPVEKP